MLDTRAEKDEKNTGRDNKMEIQRTISSQKKGKKKKRDQGGGRGQISGGKRCKRKNSEN